MKKDVRMSQQIKEIALKEMQELRMNHREFAEHLAERLSQEGDNKVGHSTVYNWANYGKPPATDFLQDLLAVYPVSDRRFVFALRMLAVKSPHVWGSDGVIWSLKKSLLPGTE
jgi:hypothetical protein